MKPERRKRHHYFPVFLQKHFCDADGNALVRDPRYSRSQEGVASGCFRREGNCTRPTRKRTSGLTTSTYEPDDRYEREFAELEGMAASAIEKLVAGTRHLDGRQ